MPSQWNPWGQQPPVFGEPGQQQITPQVYNAGNPGFTGPGLNRGVGMPPQRNPMAPPPPGQGWGSQPSPWGAPPPPQRNPMAPPQRGPWGEGPGVGPSGQPRDVDNMPLYPGWNGARGYMGGPQAQKPMPQPNRPGRTGGGK